MYYSNNDLSEDDDVDNDEPAHTFSSQREYSTHYKGHNPKDQWNNNNMGGVGHQAAHHPYSQSFKSP